MIVLGTSADTMTNKFGSCIRMGPVLKRLEYQNSRYSALSIHRCKSCNMNGMLTLSTTVLVQMMAWCRSGKTLFSEQTTDFCGCKCVPSGPIELTLYSHLVLPWYQHHWKVHDMFECLFYHAWIIIIKISFLTEGRESSIRRLVVTGRNLGFHYDNMWCQYWCKFGLSTGWSFVLRAPFNIIFTPILLWYLHHGNVYENFVCLFCYAWKLLYYYTCFFSHQKKLWQFHSFIVADGTAFWHLTACGATGDNGVAWGCRLDGLWSSMPD